MVDRPDMTLDVYRGRKTTVQQQQQPERPTIWNIVGQGPIVLAVGAGGGCLDIFTLLCLFFPLSPSQGYGLI